MNTVIKVVYTDQNKMTFQLKSWRLNGCFLEMEFIDESIVFINCSIIACFSVEEEKESENKNEDSN